MTQINVHKGVAYAVESAVLQITAHKGVAYAVEQPVQTMDVHKAVAYAVESADLSGNAKQSTAGARPIYRDGPRPYCDYSAGDSLQVNLPNTAVYTVIVYKPDDTFEITTPTLTAGVNTLPIVDFNQVVVVQGTLSAIALESVKATMRGRVIATDLPVRP